MIAMMYFSQHAPPFSSWRCAASGSMLPPPSPTAGGRRPPDGPHAGACARKASPARTPNNIESTEQSLEVSRERKKVTLLSILQAKAYRRLAGLHPFLEP